MADETDETDETIDDAAGSDEAVSLAPFVDDPDDEDDVDDEGSGPATEVDADDEPATRDGADDDQSAEGGRGKIRKLAKTAKGAEAAPERTVTRRTVTSKRVTPKGGPGAAPAGSKKSGAPGRDVDTSPRSTPPARGAYAQGPSPVWVPILMFALLVLGALVIMGNYMGVFGDPANIRLVIGLVFILGGIVTATQYR
ncbi:MAG: cell division protein CrgA [Acidimicrobiales bacterium]